MKLRRLVNSKSNLQVRKRKSIASMSLGQHQLLWITYASGVGEVQSGSDFKNNA